MTKDEAISQLLGDENTVIDVDAIADLICAQDAVIDALLESRPYSMDMSGKRIYHGTYNISQLNRAWEKAQRLEGGGNDD